MSGLTLLDELFLGLALAMDCFSVGFAAGMKYKRFVPFCMISMSVLFGLFQAMMPLIGWSATVYLGEYLEQVDHWIAFTLLAFIGGKMILDGLKPEEERSFNPEKILVILTLAVATSIDALAVGVSFTCMGMNTLHSISEPIFIIGLFSLVLSFLGNAIGIYIGKKFKIPVELIGGGILIFIGVKVLIEHLSK